MTTQKKQIIDYDEIDNEEEVIENTTMNPLKDYLNIIKGTKILSKEEQSDLCKKAQDGDAAARDKLITSCLPFVVFVSKKYTDRGVEIDDLIQEGNLALCESVDTFDSTKTTRFSNWAYFWIAKAMDTAVSREFAFGYSTNPSSYYFYRKILYCMNAPENQQKTLTAEDISKQTGIRLKAVSDMLRFISSSYIALDEHFSLEEGEITKIEMPDNSQFEEYNKNSDKNDLKEIFHKALKDNEYYIVTRILRLFECENKDATTCKAVAKEIGMSRERCRQIYQLSLSKLKKYLNMNNIDIKEYLNL